MSKYNPAEGGHAPGHLREAFGDWVELGMENDMVGEDVFFDGPKPVNWLLGQLWNCTDIMPSGLCSDLDLSPGTTYAQAVRGIKSERAA